MYGYDHHPTLTLLPEIHTGGTERVNESLVYVNDFNCVDTNIDVHRPVRVTPSYDTHFTTRWTAPIGPMLWKEWPDVGLGFTVYVSWEPLVLLHPSQHGLKQSWSPTHPTVPYLTVMNLSARLWSWIYRHGYGQLFIGKVMVMHLSARLWSIIYRSFPSGRSKFEFSCFKHIFY